MLPGGLPAEVREGRHPPDASDRKDTSAATGPRPAGRHEAYPVADGAITAYILSRLSFVSPSTKNFGLEGKVIYIADDTPVAGVLVEVFVDENPEGAKWRYPAKRIATGKTDSRGEFKFSSIPPGKYELRCSLKDFQTYSLWGIRIVPPRAKATAKPIIFYMVTAE